MKLLISLFIVFAVCMLFGRSIKKHASVWYITMFCIALAGMLLPGSAPVWLQKVVTDYITRGTLATAMFIWVMYARVLPKGSRIMTTFMGLRAPLAIGAAMLILLHNAFYIIYYVQSIFIRGNSLSVYELLAGLCTLIMWLLLIPLTVTSFMPVRRRMNPAKWKKLQRSSYLFYALIYVHVCLLFTRQILSGHPAYGRELAIYTAVFGVYLIERLALYASSKGKQKAASYFVRAFEPILAIICACIFFVPVVSYGAAYSASEEINEKSINTDEKDIESGNATAAYEDGEYTGQGMGYNGPVKVIVKIENGAIASVKVTEAEEDDPYYTWVLKQIPSAIVESGSPDVDTVSGATTSSKAVIEAVKDALEAASASE